MIVFGHFIALTPARKQNAKPQKLFERFCENTG